MTSEERLQFLRNLLVSSPPGQFDSIIKSIQHLLSSTKNECLTNEWIDETRSLYKSKLAGNNAGDDASSSHRHSNALTNLMENYIKENFSSKVSVGTTSVTNGNTPNDLIVRSYVERIDSANYHAGSWASRWNVQFLSNKEVVLSGHIEIYAHAYEEGRNFHLRSEHNFSSLTISSFSDESSLLKDIVKQISSWETEKVAEPMRDVFQEISDSTLKSLRRVLPLTRTRMDWNVLTHRMVKMLETNPANK